MSEVVFQPPSHLLRFGDQQLILAHLKPPCLAFSYVESPSNIDGYCHLTLFGHCDCPKFRGFFVGHQILVRNFLHISIRWSRWYGRRLVGHPATFTSWPNRDANSRNISEMRASRAFPVPCS